MEKSHLNILIPQWQGGGQDLSTYKGGQELKSNYLQGLKLAEVKVSTANVSEVKSNIVGYDEISKQLADAKLEIIKNNPDTIFTIGGGCDSDLASISYLNEKSKDDMVLLYFDAHGDLNTPESSESKYFYGMPVRTLLGDGNEEIINSIFSKLSPSQVLMLGIRDLDKSEIDYIKEQNISLLTVADIEKNIESVIEIVRSKGYKNIYVHIDLDVLDPTEFSYVPLPVSRGLKNNTFIELLKKLNEEFKIIGLGLLEYSPSKDKENKVIQKIVQIGSNL